MKNKATINRKRKSNFSIPTLQKQSSQFIKLLAVLLTTTFLFSSCEQVDEVVEEVKEKQKARFFEVELHPLNASGVTGTANIHYVEDDHFEVHLKARNLAPNQVHPQHIHGFGFESTHPDNAVCPPMSAAGEDGLLTLEDGLPFYGPVLIPLDDELIPLSMDDFPMANEHGQLGYLEFTNLDLLIRTINETNEGGQTLKNLALDKRVIVVHGAYVKGNRIVPADTEGAEYVASLPVACGEIKEVF